MAKLAAQLKNKFFGLVGRISCGRASAAHKDAAVVTGTKSVTTSQPAEIRSRSGPPTRNIDGGGAEGNHH